MKLIEKYMFFLKCAINEGWFKGYSEAVYWIKTTEVGRKDKDVYQLKGINGTNWNLYITELDDYSIMVSDNGEGFKYLIDLGIDIQGNGVKKQINEILYNNSLHLVDGLCIYHNPMEWRLESVCLV